MTDVAVRRARPEDHGPVVEFTRHTFEWGDYVGDRFLDWLETPKSAVFVATDQDDTALAISRVVQLSSREVWLHAARVHPDHRRQGLGRALNAASVEWGRGQGAVVAGLLTENDNTAARRQVVSLGYREVAQWFYAERSVEPGESEPSGAGLQLEEPPQQLAVAPAGDIESAYLTWSGSDLAIAAHGMIPFEWALRRMSIEDLADAVRRRAMYEAPAGWAVISPRGDGGVWVPWLVAIPDDTFSFIRAITARIAADGYNRAHLMLPRLPWLEVAAERAGYEIHPNIIWHLEIAHR